MADVDIVRVNFIYLPGTSGTLSPFSDMKSLYFNDSNEPDNFRFDFMNEMRKVLDEEGTQYVNIQFDTKEDYYRIINNLREFTENGIKVWGTTRDNMEVILEDTEDLEEGS